MAGSRPLSGEGTGMRHYSEVDLLETHYAGPDEAVSTHLAECEICSARFSRLKQKLAGCSAAPGQTSESKPGTFWDRQRIAIVRSIESEKRRRASTRPLRWAAAAGLVAMMAGTGLYLESSKSDPIVPSQQTALPMATPEEPLEPLPELANANDPWESEQLEEFQSAVAWESWLEEPESEKSL